MEQRLFFHLWWNLDPIELEAFFFCHTSLNDGFLLWHTDSGLESPIFYMPLVPFLPRGFFKHVPFFLEEVEVSPESPASDFAYLLI